MEKPKRPLSAYMLWLNSARESIKKENPDFKVTDVAKKGGEIWRGMKDKSEWEAKAAQMKKLYEAEVKEFEKNGGDKSSGGKKRKAKPAGKAKKSKKNDSEEGSEEESD
jgi:high mobility group protein B2